MAAGKYNFTIEQGSTVNFEIQYKDSTNQPINLEDYDSRMQIKNKPGGDITYLTLESYRQEQEPADKTGLDLEQDVQGKIKIYISAYSSSLLDFNKAFYDLEITSGSTHPVVTRILQGSVTLDKEVTTIS